MISLQRNNRILTVLCPAGPNPWKIALILEELSIPYETKIYATEDLKKPPFITTLNPNGFSPVIEDPNLDFKLWEVRAPALLSFRVPVLSSGLPSVILQIERLVYR